MKKKSRKPVCNLIGENGNIFNLLGIASKTLRAEGLDDKVKEMQTRCFMSGSYTEALSIISEFVDEKGEVENAKTENTNGR